MDTEIHIQDGERRHILWNTAINVNKDQIKLGKVCRHFNVDLDKSLTSEHFLYFTEHFLK